MSIDQQVADLASHHIEGYAHAALERGDDGFFSVPLISHIEGNLWTGGCIDGVRLPDDFRHVVSLYPWERYQLGPDTERVEIRMYDAADIPSPGELFEVVEQVGGFLADGKTLVHCQAGLNRSGLVSALALIAQGREPKAAVELLRERRCPQVLCNATFERVVLGQASEAA